MSAILVTGAAGFIGFHVAQRYLTEGRAVVGLDNLNDYYDPNLKIARLEVLKSMPGFRFVRVVMGVTPYISELSAFMDNVLSHTRLLYCLYIDPAHWANRLRKAVPSLNVRRLQFYERSDVDQYYAARSWNLISRTNFATGYIDLAEKRTG